MGESKISFFERIKSFYTSEETKKKAIIFTAAGAAVLIALIVTIILIASGGSDKKEEAANSDSGSKTLEKVADTKNTTPTLTEEPEPTVTEEPTATPEPTPEITATPEPTPDIAELHLAKGEVQSAINGQWISTDIAKKRPITLMFNNISVANPQSGIGEADILYEILVEAGITRCMGVFENLTEENACKDRMGSVRSARHYFVSIASEYDSIFVHYGETVYATRKLEALKVDHLEGTHAEGSTVFYRDKSIKAPHNAFASLSGILKGIEKKSFRVDHKDDFVPQHFRFAYPEDDELLATQGNAVDVTGTEENAQPENTAVQPVSTETQPVNTSAQPVSTAQQPAEVMTEPVATAQTNTEAQSGEPVTSGSAENTTEDTAPEPEIDRNRYTSVELAETTTPATMVKLGFSSYTSPYLTYDEATKLYTRYQFKGEHIDYNTKEPLKFNNIIIQIVHEFNRDKNGYQDIEGYNDYKDMSKNVQGTVTGKGYYICEGKCMEITWTKCEKDYTCNYYTPEGELLNLRPGKTFIAVYPDFREENLEIS